MKRILKNRGNMVVSSSMNDTDIRADNRLKVDPLQEVLDDYDLDNTNQEVSTTIPSTENTTVPWRASAADSSSITTETRETIWKVDTWIIIIAISVLGIFLFITYTAHWYQVYKKIKKNRMRKLEKMHSQLNGKLSIRALERENSSHALKYFKESR